MAIVIPYVKQTWIDGNPANSASAARFGVIEEGILDVSQAPAVRAFHSANQSLTTGTVTALALDSERIDQAAGVASTMHDTVTNNTRLTCRYAGVYQITGLVQFAANATGYREVFIRLNGTTNIGSTLRSGVTATIDEIIAVTSLYSLAVNDYVELMATQTSGAGLNVVASANRSPEFMMVRVA